MDDPKPKVICQEYGKEIKEDEVALMIRQGDRVVYLAHKDCVPDDNTRPTSH